MLRKPPYVFHGHLVRHAAKMKRPGKGVETDICLQAVDGVDAALGVSGNDKSPCHLGGKIPFHSYPSHATGVGCLVNVVKTAGGADLRIAVGGAAPQTIYAIRR